MEKTTEVLIRKLLKGWVNQVQPPQNGRARLLWEVSHQSRGNSPLFRSQTSRTDFNEYACNQSNEWTQSLFRWITENTVHNGIQARVF